MTLAGLNDAASSNATSEKNERTTPRALFDRLDAEYHFTLDAAASHDNALCPEYCTVDGHFFDGAEVDGYLLLRDGISIAEIWQPENGAVFCNPPYGRGLLAAFIEAWAVAAEQRHVVSVFLIPANKTEQPWWHQWIWDNEAGTFYDWVKRVEFIKGRVRYGGLKAGAQFPSMIVTFG